jgi:two-component system NtrC family sensor kinase
MGSQETILIIDDEAKMRELMGAILGEEGYLVKIAADGDEALSMLANHAFALVITDLMMPGATGLDILTEVKVRTPTTEVILITGHGALEPAIQALRQGAHDYLAKPFDRAELSYSVQRTLTYRRLKLEKSELLANLQRHNEELARMLDASNRLANLEPQPNLPLAQIVDIAQQQLAFTVGLTILTNDGEFWQAKCPANPGIAWTQILARVSPTQTQLDELFAAAVGLNKSYLIRFEAESNPPNWLTSETHLPSEPLLAVPLKTRQDRLLGVMWVANLADPPRLETIQIIEIFANQVANVLENNSFFMAQAHQVHIRNTLVQAGQRITTVLDQPQLIHTVLETMLNMMPQVELAIVYYKVGLEDELKSIGLTGQGTTLNPANALDQALVSETLRQKQTLHYPNWQHGSAGPDKTLIIEPMILANMPLGALVIISQETAAFDDDHRQILTMLANQTTIALQNARLYAEARKVDELEALHEAWAIITRTLDLQETLTSTMGISCSLTGASIGNVHLYSVHHHRIESVVTLGDERSMSDADHRRASDIAWDMLASHESDSTTKPKIISAPKNSEDDQQTIQTWLAVLLTTGISPVGVLELGSTQVNAFTADDIRLMRLIASQASAAIEKARLYEEVQQRLEQTEALSAISQSISTTLELRRVLELVVQSAATTISVATHSVLYLLEQVGDIIIPEIKVTSHDSSLPPELEQAREQAIKRATRELATIRVNLESETYGAWSLLVAPLKIQQTVIGAISVESAYPNAFLPTDETLINTFASHASIAIQNANLFRDLSSAYLDLACQQTEILRSHRTLQALFDGITDGLYIIDWQLTILAINQAEAKRLDQTPEALVGQTCGPGLWGDMSAPVLKIVQETFETSNERNWESHSNEADEGPFANRDIRTYPIFETPNRVSQVIIFAQDVSEKRRLQVSLFRSANLAAVGQLASNIAHQINNPLTVIIANTQIMEMEKGPISPDYPTLKYILEAGAQIRQIVQNLLDFSTQDRYDWFETNIQATIDDALTLVTHSLHQSNIDVVKRTEAMPPIIASASHLKLLWMNLLLNARDAICANGGAGTIEILAGAQDALQVQVKLVDNGAGIPSQHRDRLFHPFFTTKSTGKHLGLGLYTCRTIVETHQGQIEIDSKPDSPGTIVTVTLPTYLTEARG